MLYLVGVEHDRAQQWRPGVACTAPQACCAKIVRDLAQEKGVDAIAEEQCAEWLNSKDCQSVPAAVAAKLGLPHRFCDANRQQRKNIGYIGGQELVCELWNAIVSVRPDEDANAVLIARSAVLAFEDLKRERFWLERLGELRDADVLFVCGDAHAVTFPILLDAEEVRWEVVARGVGVDDSSFGPVTEWAALGRRDPEAYWRRVARLLGDDVLELIRAPWPAATGGASAR